MESEVCSYTVTLAASRNKKRLYRYMYREGAICEISLAYLLPPNTVRSISLPLLLLLNPRGKDREAELVLEKGM